VGETPVLGVGGLRGLHRRLALPQPAEDLVGRVLDAGTGRLDRRDGLIASAGPFGDVAKVGAR
jgi:hypothetical protein